MSDELERLFTSTTLVRGTSQPRPITTADEAQAFMNKALVMLRKGMEMGGEEGQRIEREAHQLLRTGQLRQVWRPLGFDSMGNCLVVNLADTFNITVAKALRLPLVIALRKQEVITPPPRKAEPKPASGPLAGPKRRDFKKSWANTFDTLLRFDRSITTQRDDSRYRQWVSDLALRHQGDLQRHYELCGQILDDFARARAKAPEHEEN